MIFSNHGNSMPSNFNFYFLSDTHCGRIGVAKDKIAKAVTRIRRDPKGFWGGGGDHAEFIAPGDKRYSSAEQENGTYKRLELQAEDFAKMVHSISGKCLFILNGNHEEKVEEIFDASRHIANILGKKIPHGGRTIHLTLGSKCKFFFTHGSGNVRSMAGSPRQIEINEAERIKRKLMPLAGDCIFMAMGHVHKIRICPPSERLAMIAGPNGYKQIYTRPYVSGNGFINEDSRWYGSTGTFVASMINGATTYAEKAMYPPTELGMLKAVVRNGEMVGLEKVIL